MNIVSCVHVFRTIYMLTYHVDWYVMWKKGMREKMRWTILYIGNLLSRDSYVTSYETAGLPAPTLLFTLIHGIAYSEVDRKTSPFTPTFRADVCRNKPRTFKASAVHAG